MASPAPKRMSLAEFLEWDDGTDTRYELIDGEVVAMAPVAPAHAVIVMNLGRRIGAALTSPCTILAGAGVARADWNDRCFVPDLAMTCAPLRPGSRFIDEPRLVVEVLSPSTRRQDRDVKLDGYREISSVEEILLVWSDKRRVQSWRRDDSRWIVEDFIGEATFQLESADLEVALDVIYENVAFEEAGEADDQQA